MLNDNSKNILENNYLLRKRKDAFDNSVFKGFKNRCFLLGIIFGFIVLISLFLISDYSNIYRITVSGNVYLSDEDIIELSGISDNSKYLFLIPSFKKKKLEKSPFIESVTITKLDNRVVNIEVIEYKQVAYIYENDDVYILLINGDKVLIDDNNIYLIAKIPLLEGYNNDQINQILRGFKAIDYNTINEISEIHRYPFSYDENMMEVIMRDGNYCFVSWTGLEMLDKYYLIVSGIDTSTNKACIFLDELTNSGYIGICPWQEQ